MPKPPPTRQVTLRLPVPLIDEADALAALLLPGTRVTQTDVLRAAIARGLKELRKDLK